MAFCPFFQWTFLSGPEALDWTCFLLRQSAVIYRLLFCLWISSTNLRENYAAIDFIATDCIFTILKYRKACFFLVLRLTTTGSPFIDNTFAEPHEPKSLIFHYEIVNQWRGLFSTDLWNLLFKFSLLILLWKRIRWVVSVALNHNTVIAKIFICFAIHVSFRFRLSLFKVRIVKKRIDGMRALLNCIYIVISVQYVRPMGYSGDDLRFAPYLLSLDFL